MVCEFVLIVVIYKKFCVYIVANCALHSLSDYDFYFFSISWKFGKDVENTFGTI